MRTLAAAVLACSLLRVASVRDADVVVYVTPYLWEDTARGRFQRCEWSRFATGSIRVFITRFRDEADLVVWSREWPAPRP